MKFEPDRLPNAGYGRAQVLGLAVTVVGVPRCRLDIVQVQQGQVGDLVQVGDALQICPVTADVSGRYRKVSRELVLDERFLSHISPGLMS